MASVFSGGRWWWLARISHHFLNTAEPMSSGRTAMRARIAKPRPADESMKDYRLFRLARALSTHAFLLSPALGAVLPKPGIHLPVGEKSGLGSTIWLAFRARDEEDERQQPPCPFSERLAS